MLSALRRLAAGAAAATALAGPTFADPAADYMLHCQGCHGPGGKGVPGNVPSFRDQVAKFLAADGGREYLLRVPGTSQSELDDGRTAALINWLLREFDPDHMPADFAPFTEAEVRRLRRPALTDVATVRQRLLRDLEAVPAAP
ncbi:MAG TPA: cytochrome c [Terriglobales bacterium]|nr:cytochrome c [Terriglobales bacterium]